MQYSIKNDDVLEWARNYDGPQFHAILCDPPYELDFMGKTWDNSGVAFNSETWALLAQHLLPGGFGMAFAGSRGWHRLAVAIEDAGLIIHPSIFGWGFGSGFPKATRIKNPQAFEGHRYGRQALKPALEPIIVFQKPYSGRAVDCITETGAGALNIDGGRIKSNDFTPKKRVGASKLMDDRPWQDRQMKNGRVEIVEGNDLGRWPANLTLTHSPDCTDGDCTDQCPVRRLGEQSGVLKSGKPVGTRNAKTGFASGITEGAVDLSGFGDQGTAARYFFNADWSLDVAEQLANADPVRYQAKASRAERDAGVRANNPHPTVKPIKLIEHLATLLLPPERYAPNRRLLVPFSGSGSEMVGAILAGWDYIQGIDLTSEYVEIAHARIKYWSVGQAKSIDNEAPKPKTPTIKPSGQITLF